MALEDRVETVERRVDSLETRFGQSMAQTGAALLRMDRTIDQMKRSNQAIEKSVERKERQAAEDRQEYEKRRQANRQEGDAPGPADQQEWEKDRKAQQREWNQIWCDMANRLGTIVGDIVAPNMPRIAREYFGIDEIEDFMERRQVRHKRDPSKRHEFDVILVGADKVIVNQTRATASIEYIDQFLEVLPELEDYFPLYRGKTMMPVFAALSINDEVVNYLSRHKVYAMGMGEETMTLLNFEKIGRA